MKIIEDYAVLAIKELLGKMSAGELITLPNGQIIKNYQILNYLENLKDHVEKENIDKKNI